MSGPAVVVVAGLATAVIAARTSDSLVTEDYYRQGMAINSVLRLERQASELGVVAHMSFRDRIVRIELPSSVPASAALHLALMRPSRATQDEAIDLLPVERNVYEGVLRSAPRGVTRIALEDRERTWRLDGAMRDAPGALTLGASQR
jgi:hypothetical protein